MKTGYKSIGINPKTKDVVIQLREKRLTECPEHKDIPGEGMHWYTETKIIEEAILFMDAIMKYGNYNAHDIQDMTEEAYRRLKRKNT